VMRTTATGKLLLLAHPRATLLVGGVVAHDAELALVCSRPSAVVLYPSADALSPAELLEARGGSQGVHCIGDAGCHDSGAQRGGGGDASLDIIVLDGTWSQARSLFRLIPPTVRKVAVDCTALRSSFGTRVRRQGADREAAGRVSTLEAYAHLALALGDDARVVAELPRYLDDFIDCLPYSRAPVDPRGGEVEVDGEAIGKEDGEVAGGGRHGPPAASAKPPLPPRTPTCPLRRRARTLKNELLVDGAALKWSKAGRALLGDVLEANPRLNGRLVQWRYDADSRVATLLLLSDARRGATPPTAGEADDEEVICAWPVSELVAESEEDRCRDVRRPRERDRTAGRAEV
jgi:DTW domain-containing protein YfiP